MAMATACSAARHTDQGSQAPGDQRSGCILLRDTVSEPRGLGSSSSTLTQENPTSVVAGWSPGQAARARLAVGFPPSSSVVHDTNQSHGRRRGVVWMPASTGA